MKQIFLNFILQARQNKDNKAIVYNINRTIKSSAVECRIQHIFPIITHAFEISAFQEFQAAFYNTW